MTLVVTKPEFDDWKQNPTTIAFFKALFNTREVMKEDHICGRYDNKEFVEGKAMLISELLSFTYEEMMEALSAKS